MMTIDDEGEGGVLANDDVITGTTIFCKFLGFSKNFSKIYEIWTIIFYFSRKFLLKLMLYYFNGITYYYRIIVYQRKYSTKTYFLSSSIDRNLPVKVSELSPDLATRFNPSSN